MKDKILRVVSLVSGIMMVLVGIYALFNGHRVIDSISGLLGLCSLIAGIVLICTRIFSKQSSAREGRFMSADGIIFVIVGLLLMNTHILHRLGRLLFVIVGIILIYNAVQSLIMALSSKKNDDGWFVPRVVFCVVLILVGVWVFSNAGKVFDDMAGIVVGVFFIVRGASLVNDWIGREKYRRNFGYLDD